MHLCSQILANDPIEKLLRQKEAEKQAKKPRIPPNVAIPGISPPLKDLSINDFYDFVFVVQEKEIKAHKAVLSLSFQEVQK